MFKFIKKLFKVVAILAAIAGVIAGIYFLIQKFLGADATAAEDDYENYVSCSCGDEEFITETTVA